MALVNQENNNRNNNRTMADGFLNLQVVDAEGNTHNISCVIPLYEEEGSSVNRSILKSAKENGENKEFQIIGTVHLSKTTLEEIPF